MWCTRKCVLWFMSIFWEWGKCLSICAIYCLCELHESTQEYTTHVYVLISGTNVQWPRLVTYVCFIKVGTSLTYAARESWNLQLLFWRYLKTLLHPILHLCNFFLDFKDVFKAYKAQNGLAPPYLVGCLARWSDYKFENKINLEVWSYKQVSLPDFCRPLLIPARGYISRYCHNTPG